MRTRPRRALILALLLAGCSESTPFDSSGVDLAGTWHFTVRYLDGNGQQGVTDNEGGYSRGPCTATWTADVRDEPLLDLPEGMLYTEVTGDAIITCPEGTEPWSYRGMGLILERQPEDVITLMRLTHQYFARGEVVSNDRVTGKLYEYFGNKPFTAERQP
jgi:hypothetical protein